MSTVPAVRSPRHADRKADKLNPVRRTFCAQNCFPAVLLPIDEMPPYEESENEFGSITQAFSSLTRLFSHLQSNMMDSSMASRSAMDPTKVAAAQADLCAPPMHPTFTEVQRVDLFVTRQWIRILIWEYTTRHFKMSRDPSNQAFSLLLPITIARELLCLFPSVSAESIYAHGYGMVSVPALPPQVSLTC